MNGEDDDLAPHSAEAEAALLGAVLISPAAFEYVKGKVRPEDFFRERHRLIFAAMLSLAEEGQPLDPLTVSDRIEQQAQTDVVGGFRRIDALAAEVPAAGHAAYYAEIVARHARARLLLNATYNAQSAIGRGDIAKAEEALREVLAA